MLMTLFMSVLGSWGGCHRIPEIKWLMKHGNWPLTVPEAGNSKIKELTHPGSGDSPILPLRWALLSVSLPGEGALWGPFHKGTHLVSEHATLLT